MMQTVDQMKLSNGEILVKKYYCATMIFPKCYGYLYVTNKRVIFHGKSDSNRIANEILLDAVGGISCSYGPNINISLILYGVLTLIGSFLFGLIFGGFAVMLGLITAGILFYLSYEKAFSLSIYSSQASGCPIAFGNTDSKLSAKFALRAEPTAETDAMLNELYAMIIDLKNEGDLAIERWSGNAS